MNRILVVDDSAVDRRLAGGLLSKIAQTVVEYAENVEEGLSKIAASPPDLVLTDLKMPGKSGLELVQEVRHTSPGVPVILMTAQGSEDVAIQALLFGAASYVPKSRLATDLAETVEHVLGVANVERHEEDLLRCLTRAESSFAIRNDPSLVPPLVKYLQSTATRVLDCDETERLRIGIALEEALLNALYHGNLEVSSELREGDSSRYYQLARERSSLSPYQDRRIYVDAHVTREEARFTIRDEGQGFDPELLPDPTDPANLEKPSGRGLLLMRAFMDEVRLNDVGNEVTMVKTNVR